MPSRLETKLFDIFARAAKRPPPTISADALAHGLQTTQRSFVVLPCGLPIPMQGLVTILRDAVAGAQRIADRELGFDHALLRRSLEPLGRLRRIGLAALSPASITARLYCAVVWP